MKKMMIIGVLLLLCASVACAQEVKTIKGEVVDVSCYTMAGAKGAEHMDCAAACMKAGQPAGILEDGTGTVYVAITSDHTTNPATKLMPFVAKKVEVTATVYDKGGVKTIEIKDIKGA